MYGFQQQLYSADYIPFIQSRLGGHATRWHEMFQRLNDRPIEELIRIDDIFANTQARSWLVRKANSFRFVRLESIARTLDRLYMEQIDLSRIRTWEELSLTERRALLLVVFKKWWWEVDSHQVLGFSRWTDPSYLLSRSLTEPLALGRLDSRLHELLSSPSQTSFLSSLIGNFRSEIRTLKSLKGEPEAREVLLETLAYRIEFLKRMKGMHQIEGQKGTLLQMQILRAAVLREILQKGRALQKTEIAEVARQHGIEPSLANGMFWGQLGVSLIPNVNTLLNVAVDIAVTTAIATVVSHYFFDDLENDEVYRGDFNDLFQVTPVSED